MAAQITPIVQRLTIVNQRVSKNAVRSDIEPSDSQTGPSDEYLVDA
jgi:hypothetical protein